MSRGIGVVALALVSCFVSISAARAHSFQEPERPTPFSRRARLEPKFNGLVTLALNGDTTRQGFEKLAALAGIQVVFHSKFQEVALPPDFVLNAVSVFDALDRLSRQVGVFWETYDSKTILVAPDEALIRAQVETQILRPVGFPAGAGAPKITDYLNALRGRVEMKQLAVSTPGNAVLLRGLPENVTQAEEIFGAVAASARAGVIDTNLPGTFLIDMFGNVFMPGAGALRKVIAPARSELTPKNAGLVTVSIPQGPARDAFRKFGENAGIQVFFHRAYPASPDVSAFSIKDVDTATALDLLSFQTGSFWQVLDAHTILVAIDNPTIRRDVEPTVIKTVYFRNLEQQLLVEAITGLRSMVGLNQFSMALRENALLLRDTPGQVDLAERIAGVLDNLGRKTSSASGPVRQDAAIPAGNWTNPTDSDWNRAVRSTLKIRLPADGTRAKAGSANSGLPGPTGIPPRSPLPPFSFERRAEDRITLRLNLRSRQAFEALAEVAGLQVLFHRQFQDQAALPFEVQDVDILTALDRLALQTGNFWRVVDSHTIVVATDNPTVRRDIETTVIQAFYLKNVTRPPEMTEVVTALRSLLSFNQIAMSTRQNALVLRDTPDKIALAEKIIAVFDRPPAGASGAPTKTVVGPAIPSGVFANPVDRDVTQAMRAQLQLRVGQPVTIRMNQRSRQTFETVADLAGLQVVFHRQFQDQAPLAFVVDEGSISDALDQLAFATGNFWRVDGPHTIVVATDNPTVRRDVMPMITKTIYLSNAGSAPEATEIVTGLRTLLSMNQLAIVPSVSAIVLRDTEDKVALAEKLVAAYELLPRVSTSPPIASGVFAQPMDQDARRARLQSLLKLDSAGMVRQDMRQPSREAYQTLAALAGLRVEFHDQFSSAAAFAFRADDVDLLTALDRLAFQTGTFWEPSDQGAILAATDNPTVRKVVEPIVTKTIVLTNITTAQGVTEVITVLRTIVSMDVQPSPSGITFSDTVDKIALAERIIATLDIPGRMPLPPGGPNVVAPSPGAFQPPFDPFPGIPNPFGFQ